MFTFVDLKMSHYTFKISQDQCVPSCVSYVSVLNIILNPKAQSVLCPD